jgi:hypothetical protein
MTKPPIDPDLAQFSQAVLCSIAGIDNETANNWAKEKRGIIRSVSGGRKMPGRRLYSLSAIFTAKLARLLVEDFGMGPSEAGPIKSRFAEAIAKKVSGGNWMWALGRAIENSKPLKIVVCTRRQSQSGKWDIAMRIGDENAAPKFDDPRTPYLLLPVSAIFESVYIQCKRILSSDTPPGSKGL